MSQEIQNVLLVPGLYPRGCEALQRYAYNSIVPAWQAAGYDLVVQQFGWNDRLSLADRQDALLEAIASMPNNLCAIGASAGGLAVINAFRGVPSKFHKVLTVASPLSLTEADFASFKDNPFVPIPDLLREAYHQADDVLNTLSAEGLAKVVSLHGLYDPRVLPQWSQRPGIATYELPTRGHAKTIMGALRKHRDRTQDLLAA